MGLKRINETVGEIMKVNHWALAAGIAAALLPWTCEPLLAQDSANEDS